MKNRRVLNIAGILIIAGMLAGCAKTPESSLVRQKGDGTDLLGKSHNPAP